MELGRQRRAAARAEGSKTPDRGSAAPFRAVSAGGAGGWNLKPPHRLVSGHRSFGGIMGKDKSILEKITGTIKDIATIASEAADHAMKAEPAPVKVDERSASYIPLAADGLVSDPMMVPPIAAAHVPRRKRAASKRGARASKTRPNKTRPKKAVKKSVPKSAKKSAARRSRSA